MPNLSGAGPGEGAGLKGTRPIMREAGLGAVEQRLELP